MLVCKKKTKDSKQDSDSGICIFIGNLTTEAKLGYVLLLIVFLWKSFSRREGKYWLD